MAKIFLLLISLLFLAESGQAADRVRLSVVNPNLTFLPAGVALKKGFFKEEGLEAEVIRMTSPIAMTALSNGDIDYTMSFGSVVTAAIRGFPVRMVASMVDSSLHALVVRPEFKSVKDLRGKTLGVSAFGASDHVVALMMFKHFGVDGEKEIKVAALGGSQAQLAALEKGLVQVGVISPPGDYEGEKMGFHVLARAYELFNFPIAGLGTNVRKIKERPDEVKRMARAMIKASRFIRENREGAIQLLVEWGKVRPEHAASSYDSSWKAFSPDGTIPEDGLQLLIEQGKKDAKIAREVSFGEIGDFAILREAQRELGLKKP